MVFAFCDFTTTLASMCDENIINACLPVVAQRKPFTMYPSKQTKKFHTLPPFIAKYNTSGKGVL
jgi:hypothetical protein